jgi:ribosomal protein S18 acetylase RimI-like enzyme
VPRQITQQTVLDAIGANKRELIGTFRLFPDAQVHDGPDLLWTITSQPCALFNALLCARLAPGETSSTIAAAISRAQSRGVPFLWWVSPNDRPADLGDRLIEHGLVVGGSLKAMALDLGPALDVEPRLPGFSLGTAADAASRRDCSRIVAECFQWPAQVLSAWQNYYERCSQELEGQVLTYVAHQRGAAVATAALFLAAGVAGIYNVATLPEARRQGIGTALVRAACADARDRGYRLAVLEASDMGAGVYRRIGFRGHGEVAIYVWAAGIGARD